MTNPNLLSASQLAAKLGVSKPMVTKYKASGKIIEEPGGGFDLEKARSQLAASNGSRRRGTVRRGDRGNCDHAQVTATASIRKEAEDAAPRPGSKAYLEQEALAERIRRERRLNDIAEKLLVNRHEVEAATEKRIRDDAEALLAWPNCVAAVMAAEIGTEERLLATVLEKYVRRFMQERSMVGV